MMVIQGNSTHQQRFHQQAFNYGRLEEGELEYTFTVLIPTGTVVDPTPNFVFDSSTLTLRHMVDASLNETRTIITTGTPATGEVLAEFEAATGTSPDQLVLTFSNADPIDAADEMFEILLPGFRIDIDLLDAEFLIYPADMCTWYTAVSSEGGYEIHNAQFWNGASATPTHIPFPQLGFIGKSGRFVKIAN